ncbi:MAG: hypothetical protein ACMG6H_03590 [Acidobacteriota bacterium]
MRKWGITMRRVPLIPIFITAFSVIASNRGILAISGEPHTNTPQFEQQRSSEPPADPSVVKRKADALMAFLDKTKDKRVEKVVLRKFNWVGAVKEEDYNYNVKLGEAKYTVIRPGKDMLDTNYLVFVVKLIKNDPGFLVADDDRDGSVDRGFIQNKKATPEEKREFDAKKAIGTQQKDFWQADYVKAVDALCQYLGVSLP